MNPYNVTTEDVKQYATERGIPIPEDAVISQRLILAVDKFETLEQNFKGQRTDPQQVYAWPRKGVVVRGTTLPDDQIPNVVKMGLIQCVTDMRTATELIAEGNDKPTFAIKRTKTDVLETEYATGANVQLDLSTDFSAVGRILTDVLRYSMTQMRTIR